MDHKGTRRRLFFHFSFPRADADGTSPYCFQTGEIVFVLDPRSAPTLVDRPSKPAGSGTSDAGDSSAPARPRRLSLASLRRSSSRGSASGDAHAAHEPAHAHEHEHASEHTGDASEHQGGGIRGFVHKIVTAISPSSSHPKDLSAEDTPGDGLRRVSTREAEAARANAAAAGKQPEVTAEADAATTGAVQFDEPNITHSEEDPLPAYKASSSLFLPTLPPLRILTLP